MGRHKQTRIHYLIDFICTQDSFSLKNALFSSFVTESIETYIGIVTYIISVISFFFSDKRFYCRYSYHNVIISLMVLSSEKVFSDITDLLVHMNSIFQIIKCKFWNHQMIETLEWCSFDFLGWGLAPGWRTVLQSVVLRTSRKGDMGPQVTFRCQEKPSLISTFPVVAVFSIFKLCSKYASVSLGFQTKYHRLGGI